jgi:beta-phosphoglucomutase-like phosphatase (HAD superfamily)
VFAHGVVPDLIFGWGLEPHMRRPSPYPVGETIRQLGLKPQDVLVMNDLKPGVDMAKAGGVDAAEGGWSHDIPSIRDFMKGTGVAYFATVPEFAEVILQ